MKISICISGAFSKHSESVMVWYQKIFFFFLGYRLAVNLSATLISTTTESNSNIAHPGSQSWNRNLTQGKQQIEFVEFPLNHWTLPKYTTGRMWQNRKRGWPLYQVCLAHCCKTTVTWNWTHVFRQSRFFPQNTNTSTGRFLLNFYSLHRFFFPFLFWD